MVPFLRAYLRRQSSLMAPSARVAPDNPAQSSAELPRPCHLAFSSYDHLGLSANAMSIPRDDPFLRQLVEYTIKHDTLIAMVVGYGRGDAIGNGNSEHKPATAV
jgi:hypothetical protein